MRVINLASGSKGNATLIESNGTKILVDDGLTLSELKRRLAVAGVEPKDISAIFVSHAHNDHISGIQKFCDIYKPLVFATAKTWMLAQERCLKGCSQLDFNYAKKRVINESDTIELDNFIVNSFPVPHDLDTVGFCFEAEGRKVSIVTDIGRFTSIVENMISGSDLIMLESNHDTDMLIGGNYAPMLKRRILSDVGHLSNEECGEAIRALAQRGTKHFLLMHLSEENNTPELAIETIYAKINDMVDADNIQIYVSSQHQLSKNFILKNKLEGV